MRGAPLHAARAACGGLLRSGSIGLASTDERSREVATLGPAELAGGGPRGGRMREPPPYSEPALCAVGKGLTLSATLAYQPWLS